MGAGPLKNVLPNSKLGGFTGNDINTSHPTHQTFSSNNLSKIMLHIHDPDNEKH